MKYALKNNCIYDIADDVVRVVDLSTHNKFELTELMCDIFILFFKENRDDSFVLDYLIKKGMSSLHARKELNKLIYALYNHKFISCRNDKIVGRNRLFIHSCLLEITNACNFRCPHCYVDKHNKYLSFEEIKEFADELYDLNCNSITLTGGEVFTHLEFGKIYEYLYTKGFLISLNTNGSLINEKILKLFDLMPPNIVEISLYGYDEETYNNFTKCKNCFEKVVENVKKLKEHGIEVKLKNVITNSNKNHFIKIKDVASREGCQFRSDYISFPQINKNGQVLNPEQINIENVMQYLSNFSSCEEYYLRLFSTSKNTNKVFKCKKKDDNFFMNVDKNICFCICMQSNCLQYQNGQLAEALIELRKYKNLVYRKDAKCKNCKYAPLCRYCPGKFEMSTHDFQTPHQWFCDLGQAIYNKYVKGYHLVQKKYLNKSELQKVFDIVANNMRSLGFEISSGDKEVWANNLQQNLLDEKFWLFLFYFDGKIVGFVEMGAYDEKLFLSELQLCDCVKNTRILPFALNKLLEFEGFAQYDEIFFNINKNNKKSRKTFEHLGGVVVENKQNSCLYVIKREKIHNYFNQCFSGKISDKK